MIDKVGYGFLSENSTFARKCRENGIRFIGPTPESMEILGNKKQAKIELSRKEPSIPLIPGHACEDQSVDALIREADKIGILKQLELIHRISDCFKSRCRWRG